MFEIMLIFGGGILLDVLHTRYVKFLTGGARYKAALCSGLITITSLTVWGWVLTQVQSHGWTGAIALAGGASVGTFVSGRLA